MSETKHTPGPWSVNECHVYRYDDEYDETICDTSGAPTEAAFMSDVPDRAEANARLIAAAPELLEACKRLMGRAFVGSHTPREQDPLWKLAHAAIAKAEGKDQS